MNIKDKGSKKYLVTNETKDEDLLFRLFMAIMEPLPTKAFKILVNRYNRIEHCENYVQGKFNFKCGLPKGHKGDHLYIMMWSESEGMYAFTPRSSPVPSEDRRSDSLEKDIEISHSEDEPDSQ
ncbi:MAG: hypothetical protein JRL30_20335 [Deltaproteobacteria bacterium]|nr:hypothetical protein [Deltaproteobacteria bacterium]